MRPVRVVDNWRDCLEGVDIMVEASRLPEPQPLFLIEWVKKGAIVAPYGPMSAVELSLTDIIDKIVVVDRGQCGPGRPFGSLRRHVDEGKLTPATLHAEMGEVVAGRKPGRESDDVTNLFWHHGFSTSDIALGWALMKKAARQGVGQQLRFA